MKNQIKKHRKFLYRNLALVLILALVIVQLADLTGFTTGSTSPASTYESLPGIETIKANTTEEDSFNILEIVPTDGSGAIGYYIPGYEPIFEDYANDLSVIERADGASSAAERETYFADKITTLTELGYIATDNSTLLTEREYAEYIDVPWATKPADFANYTQLKLFEPVLNNTSAPRYETVDYTGNFINIKTDAEASNDDTGYFNEVEKYTIATNSADATHGILNAQFIFNGSDKYEGDHAYDFFYEVQFQNLNDLEGAGTYASLPLTVDDPLTTEDNEDETLTDYLKRMDVSVRVNSTPPTGEGNDSPNYFPETYLYVLNDNGTEGDTADDYYDYIGKTTEQTLVLDTGYDNFYVAIVPDMPSSTPPASGNYFGADEPIMSTEAANKQFTLSYDYEPSAVGYGDYIFELSNDPAAQTYTHSYNEVYIKLPYVNNNWFSTYVFNDFDKTDGDNPPITVSSISAEKVQVSDVEGADLIVLSSGITLEADDDDNDGDIDDDDADFESLTDLYGQTNLSGQTIDISQAAKDKIVELIGLNSGMTPIIVNSDLEDISSSATNLSYLINDYITTTYNTEDEDGFVLTNLYYFEADDDEAHLSTPNFTKQFESSTYQSDGRPYYPILEEIESENFFRETLGVETLPEDINIATAIRYVINYSNNIRIDNQKESINVLEIQPIVPLDNSGKKTQAELTPKFVSENFLNGTISEDKINIDTMAITEFIGKIDDITEVYDMVYIGASVEGFNVGADGEPTYNDTNMNGLYYSNIGDLVEYSPIIAGLLESDYQDNPSNNLTLFDGTSSRDSEKDVYPLKSSSTHDFMARYSGYDFTQIKMDEIINFANSGFPIIISDKLITSYTPEIPATEVDVEVSVQVRGIEATLTVISPSNISVYPHTLSYQWYKDGSAISGATDSSYTTQAIGTFYCEVTVNGVDSSTNKANSAKFELTNDGIDVRVTNTPPTGTTSPVIKPATYSDTNRFTNKNEQGYYFPISNKYYTDKVNGIWTMTPNLNFIGATNIEYSWYGDKAKLTETEHDSISLTDNYQENDRILEGELIKGGSSYPAAISYVNARTTSGDIVEFFSTREGIDQVNTSKLGPFRASAFMLGKPSSEFPIPTSHTYNLGISSTLGVKTSIYKLEAEGLYNKNDDTLQIIPDVVDFPNGLTPVFTFDWYSYDGSKFIYENQKDSATTASTFGVDDDSDIGDKYAVVISDGSETFFDTIYFEFAEGKAFERVEDSSDTLTIPLKPETALDINEDTVDNSSIVYDTIEAIYTKENVMSTAKAFTNPDTIVSYLNLSKPEIVFETKVDESGNNVLAIPAEYEDMSDLTRDTSQSLFNTKELSYTFTIENLTDPTPAQTRYTVNLFIDLDADGLHRADETIPNLVIKNDGQIIKNGELKSGVEYEVSRILPDNYQGAIPWKLEIVQVDKETAHNSQTGITFVRPDAPVTINVLQLVGQYYTSGSDGTYLYTAAPEKQDPLSESPTFSKLFDELRDAGIYNITTTAVSITELNLMYEETNDTSKIEALFDEYDMLMFGFQESYGKLDLYNGFIEPVTDFINEEIANGKPALFSHDNISSENIPYTNAPQVSGPYSSYFTNILLRDEANQDRYGVTSREYGYSESNYLSNHNEENNFLVANAYKTADTTDADSIQINAETQQEILDAGYSLAYMPKSDKTELVQETQGYSIFFMLWQGYISDSVNKPHGNQLGPTNGDYDSTTQANNYAVTGKVSQVNQGQITSFPYNVNTAEFGGTGSTIPIRQTHQQWYQLNMNAEDVVVWYSLAYDTQLAVNSAGYQNHYNDVMNGYYIYSVGNVTFTGAGHNIKNDLSVFTVEAEAKLFVNTMIAAYRTASTDPTISFEDESGNLLTNFYLPGVYTDIEDTSGGVTGSLSAEVLNSDTYNLPFIVDDPNVRLRQLDISALYVQDEDGEYYKTVSGKMLKIPASGIPTTGDNDIIAEDNTRFSKATNITIADHIGLTVLSQTQYYLDLLQTKVGATNLINYLAESDTTSIKLYIEVSSDDFTGLSNAVELTKLGMFELN